MPAMHLSRAGELWVTSHRQSGQGLREGGGGDPLSQLLLCSPLHFQQCAIISFLHLFTGSWPISSTRTLALGGCGYGSALLPSISRVWIRPAPTP